jgi:hypothetical protein
MQRSGHEEAYLQAEEEARPQVAPRPKPNRPLCGGEGDWGKVSWQEA